MEYGAIIWDPYKNKNKNKNIYYSNQWAHNRGKQIAYIDYCHWRQLYIYIYMFSLIPLFQFSCLKALYYTLSKNIDYWKIFIGK
jgi:hypothetical protein